MLGLHPGTGPDSWVWRGPRIVGTVFPSPKPVQFGIWVIISGGAGKGKAIRGAVVTGHRCRSGHWQNFTGRQPVAWVAYQWGVACFPPNSRAPFHGNTKAAKELPHSQS